MLQRPEQFAEGPGWIYMILGTLVGLFLLWFLAYLISHAWHNAKNKSMRDIARKASQQVRKKNGQEAP